MRAGFASISASGGLQRRCEASPCIDDCPFVDLPNSKASRWGGGVPADEMREMQWVRPELGGADTVRRVDSRGSAESHAAFLGLRCDKSAREVGREMNEVPR